MQFIPHGPDVPDALLQAHEEGRVVFFCGAGISYPARLPGFAGLTRRLIDELGHIPSAIQRAAIKAQQFDTAIGLLEGVDGIVGGREEVRRKLATILTPDLTVQGATSTHESLLTLARNRDGVTRLITTNFDRLFQIVIERDHLPVPFFSAPLLPVPKKRWDGIVYLHGLLTSSLTSSDLDRLVVSSGDFGLAYLIERWAARFVSELFRNYTVCFVGYSISDPVLRYMMDALAADRLLGESPPEIFAFGSFSKGKEGDRANEWRAKNVTPILYREHNRHAFLHKTLRKWAATHRDGTLGKERIVVDYAMARPSASTRQDDFVSRMLWALSHESGLPAKRFADFDPVPPLDWLLEAFSENRYRHDDLVRFGVPPQAEVDRKLGFSLVRRPAPYSLAPWMMLTSGNSMHGNWDNVMFHLARWLVRHLDDPRLILWLAEQGGQLHYKLAQFIEQELDRILRLESECKSDELARIRTQSPNAIPRPLLRPVWRLLLSGRLKSPWRNLDLNRWKERLRCEGVTATLIFELRELLSPKVTIKKPFTWSESEPKAKAPERLREVIDWELELAADHVHASIRDLGFSKVWQETLPKLLSDFQQLLGDALNLASELGDANDRSVFHLPSIKPHSQNRGYCDWVALIELLRDAWLAVRATEAIRAAQIAQEWFSTQYPTFKRLALFAASHDDCITPDQWVDWLLSADNRWLWSLETRRETLRVFVLQGAHLTPSARERLEAAIVNGPPRTMFRDDLTQADWENLVDHSTWLHLAKLKSSGTELGPEADCKLRALSAKHAQWQIAKDERDEFSHWTSQTGDSDFEERRGTDLAPRKRTGLVNWLRHPPSEHSFHEDNWHKICQTRFFHSALSLCDLANENQWPVERWNVALQAWSDEPRIKRSWNFVAPLVQRMPDEVLKDVAHSLTWWLESASKSIDRHEAILLNLCRRVLATSHQSEMDTDEPVTQAINHPIGHVTQALLNLWFKSVPNDNDGLPAGFSPIFTQLCDKSVTQFRHARVLLASRLIALFRVDRVWTETQMLPLLDWHNDAAEARAAWSGFLWSPRLYRPLLVAFKKQFLDTAHHYETLGVHGDQFACLLTYAALEPLDTYTVHDFQAALAILPQKGLQDAAQALFQALEAAGEKREDYWANRIYPLWQRIWPKSRQLASMQIAESLAGLSIAARNQFPAALDAVLAWLQPIEHPGFIVGQLCESGLARCFPEDALRLLNAIIGNQSLAPHELAQCLIDISQAAPALQHDGRYKRLLDCSKR